MAVETLTDKQAFALPTHLIVVRRRRFKLTLYKRTGQLYSPVRSCRIAVGALGFTTPTGPHVVTKKESPPSYTAPNSLWARAAGYRPGEKLEPDDPANPIRGAFIWLGNEGVGIHGTSSLLSLGSRASHGCVRTSEEDAVFLYETVPLGTCVVVI